MTMNWQEAASELVRFGCSIKLLEGTVYVKLERKDSPLTKERFSSLVQILRNHKEEIVNNPFFLIEQTLSGINEIWESNFLNFLKLSKPGEWKKVRNLEEKINQDTLKGDLNQLKPTLSEYRQLIIGLVKKFGIISKQNSLTFQQDSPIKEKEYGT